MKEFAEMQERDAFLVKEMEDLEKSIQSLQALISDLKVKINIEFENGIGKINKEFQDFFALMFGGGTGNLLVVNEIKKKKGDEEEGLEEEQKIEPGIEINVSLPH